jgi:hypothetical protein
MQPSNAWWADCVRLDAMKYRCLLLAIYLYVVLSGCRSKEPIRSQPTIEEAQPLASVVRMGDAAAGSQLLSGFGAVEANSWRWSGPQFAVALGVPPGAKQTGAALALEFSLPDVSIKTLKQLTVSAVAGDVSLAAETYSTPGAHTYSRDIPASAFKSEPLQVRFNVDKFLKPEGDNRQLSLVVTSVELKSK